MVGLGNLQGSAFQSAWMGLPECIGWAFQSAWFGFPECMDGSSLALKGFYLSYAGDTSRAVAAAIRPLCTLFVLVFDFAIGYNSRRFALQGVKHTDYPRGEK